MHRCCHAAHSSRSAVRLAVALPLLILLTAACSSSTERAPEQQPTSPPPQYSTRPAPNEPSEGAPGIPVPFAAPSPSDPPPRQSFAFAFGSGFAVGTGLSVVTNDHVVDDCTEIVVKPSDGSAPRPAVLRFRDSGEDLALLSLETPLAAALPLAFRDVRPGEPVAVYGYPERGDEPPRFDTVVAAVAASAGPQPGRRIPLIGPVRAGMSGGAVLNGRGRVAGVLVQVADPRTAVASGPAQLAGALAIDRRIVAAFLTAAGQAFTVPKDTGPELTETAMGSIAALASARIECWQR
ncbi:MAG: serine protease [Pseudomonadota bacterium]